MPIIEWGNWQAAQEAITQGNNALSGMKPPAAENALKFTKVTLNDGTVRYVANTVTPPQTNPQLNYDTGSLEAYYEYVGNGGSVTQTGAASTGSNATQVNNMAMTQKAGGLAGVGALLSVNLPTAAAAIAPIAGIALGAGLYSLNPDLWEKISRALLPFCYDDTELLPVVADETGKTYFPKEAIDAVKNVVNENIYDTASTPASPIANKISPYPFIYSINNKVAIESGVGNISNYFQIATDSPVHICVAKYNNIVTHPSGYTYQSFLIFIASESSYKIGINRDKGAQPELNRDGLKTNYQGKTFYISVYLSSVEPSIGTISVPYNVNMGLDTGLGEEIGYEMLFGETNIQEQPGITKWAGVPYPLNPEGIGVVTRISPDGQLVTTAPYDPVTMPVGDPGVSPNPNEVPIPGVNPEVAPAVDPWVTPKPDKETYPEGQPESKPAPIENPVPDYNPDLDPAANPSEEIEPKPKEDPDQSTIPTDIGTTSPPIIPVIPVLPSAATGLLHVYNPTQTQLDSFGSWLWNTFSGDLIDTVSKLFNDPMDAVIGLHELYVTPAVSGSSTIKAGFLDSKVSSNLVGSRYTTINCGSIVVQEYYQNYLDYSPYTKCYIYLPFVGIAPVLADDIIGNAVNVTYHVDSYTGCCIAVVTVAREGYSSTVYQFEGNCAVEIPITSGYQSTLMGALIGIGGAALTGNPHAGIAAANMGRASLGKNDVSHSGSFGSSYGAMGAKIPYIIVKRPTQKSVVNYNQDYGFPAHKRVTIGACSGYLRAREVHVISPTATDDEKARIEELLKEGVFVK